MLHFNINDQLNGLNKEANERISKQYQVTKNERAIFTNNRKLNKESLKRTTTGVNGLNKEYKTLTDKVSYWQILQRKEDTSSGNKENYI